MQQLKERNPLYLESVSGERYTNPFFFFSCVEAPVEKKGLYGKFSHACYRIGARYYDADIGLWISPDPARQFHSLYSYVGGNPISSVDPNGLWEVHVTGNPEEGYNFSTVDDDRQYAFDMYVNGSLQQSLDISEFVDAACFGCDAYGFSAEWTFAPVAGAQVGINFMHFRETGENQWYIFPGAVIGAEASIGASGVVAWYNDRGKSVSPNKESWLGGFFNGQGNIGVVGFGAFLGRHSKGDPYWWGITGGIGAGVGGSVSYQDYHYLIPDKKNAK